MGKVTVRVPATSANLGPGFDCLGIALDIYAKLSFEETDGPVEITGGDPRYRTADNLACVAYYAALRRMNRPVSGVRIHIGSDIPVSHGLGSSAALYAAGALAASALNGNALSREELLDVTNALEGHPDNLAPAIFGGFTAAMTENGVPYAIKLEASPKLMLCALIPETETSTEKARSALPQTVPFGDAVFNISRTAFMVKAIETGDCGLLRLGAGDRLHEDKRKLLIPGFDAMKRAALAAGASAFVISGSGPTCIAFCDSPETEKRVAAAAAGIPGSWRATPVGVDTEGALVI